MHITPGPCNAYHTLQMWKYPLSALAAAYRGSVSCLSHPCHTSPAGHLPTHTLLAAVGTHAGVCTPLMGMPQPWLPRQEEMPTSQQRAISTRVGTAVGHCLLSTSVCICVCVCYSPFGHHPDAFESPWRAVRTLHRVLPPRSIVSCPRAPSLHTHFSRPCLCGMVGVLHTLGGCWDGS